jgi:ABC-type phosphate/phosphonate transport system substrate-binding protein
MFTISPSLGRLFHRTVLLAGGVLTLLGVVGTFAKGHQLKLETLLIGTSGSGNPENWDAKTERGAIDNLKNFIKEETGLTNDIVRQKDWVELADKMVKGQLHLGVFQGYEFAWAQARHPELKPLAIAVNVHRYPVACLVVKQDSPTKDFAGLKGQSLQIPGTGDRYLNLYVEHECKAAGHKPEAFFSKISSVESVEDALENVVDGAVQAAVADQAALDAYQRRKPGRFKKLKEVGRSQPFPPTVVAYGNMGLEQSTLKRFQEGLLGAHSKEKGQTILTLFRTSAFESIPEDFGKVLAETRKTYPAPQADAKR